MKTTTLSSLSIEMEELGHREAAEKIVACEKGDESAAADLLNRDWPVDLHDNGRQVVDLIADLRSLLAETAAPLRKSA